MTRFEFLEELCRPETRVLQGRKGEDLVILACIVLIQCQGVTDGHTDRRTDAFA